MRRVVVAVVAAATLPLLAAGASAPARGEGQVATRGVMLEERGDFAQAKGAYLDGLRRFPRSAEIHFRLGAIFLREGNWAEAGRHLRQASTLRPRHVDTLYYLAQACYLDGQHAAARDAIHRAATLAPERADVAQKYGEYLCEFKVCQEGLRYLLKAQRLDPNLPNIDFDLGMAQHRLAALAEAQRYLEVAVQRDPDNMIAARFLADLLDRSSEWQRAKELYERVIAREPQNAWAFYGLGHALIALNKPEEALAPLRRALELDPTIARAHYQLGRALRALGRVEDAQRALGLFRALRERQEASAPPVKADRTRFENRLWDECRRLVSENKESEALAHLDSVLEGSGQDPHYLLGVLYFNLNRGSDAARLLAEAVAASPGDADALAFLGRAYVLEGQHARADEALTKAVTLKPDGELPLVGRGELEYARGRWADAIRSFEQAKTSQVPVLLKLCRAYLLAGDRPRAHETAEVVRAFASGDRQALRQLDSMLHAPEESATPAAVEMDQAP
jgi:tetratricopeptide (TPR) repeat protein